jgi:hypothetical protein
MTLAHILILQEAARARYHKRYTLTRKFVFACAQCLKNALGAKRCLSLRPALRPVLCSFRATRAGDTRAVEEGAGDGGGAGVAVLTQPPDVKKATEIERKQAIEFKVGCQKYHHNLRSKRCWVCFSPLLPCLF